MLYRHKNEADKMIVVYADDERHGIQSAQIIFEKGFDNVYLLTGCLVNFAFMYYSLIEGTEIPTTSQLEAIQN